MKKIYSILALVAMTTVANAQNLVQNPSFEDWTNGKPNNWLTSGLTFEKTDDIKNSGVSAISVESKSKTSTLGAKDINVVAGKVYVYSGWYLDNDGSAEFKYWGQWRTNTANISDNSMQASDPSSDAPEWKQFRVEATAPADATIARLSLRTYRQGANIGGKIYFDDISFVEKETLSVADTNSLEKSIKINTIVNDILTIYTDERVTLNIYSLEGKLISSNRVSNRDSINLGYLQKGNYIVTIDNGSYKISKKIIKK